MDFQQFVARIAKAANVRELLRSLFVQAKGRVARDLLGQVGRIETFTFAV